MNEITQLVLCVKTSDWTESLRAFIWFEDEQCEKITIVCFVRSSCGCIFHHIYCNLCRKHNRRSIECIFPWFVVALEIKTFCVDFVAFLPHQPYAWNPSACSKILPNFSMNRNPHFYCSHHLLPVWLSLQISSICCVDVVMVSRDVSFWFDSTV